MPSNEYANSKDEHDIVKTTETESNLKENQATSELENLSKSQLIHMVSTSFRGPIPDPRTLEGYEKVLKGSADRIIAITEKELDHAHKMEERAISAESRDSLLGIIAAFLLAIFIVSCGTIIILKVSGVAGIIAGSLLNLSGIGTIVGNFLKISDKKDK